MTRYHLLKRKNGSKLEIDERLARRVEQNNIAEQTVGHYFNRARNSEFR